MYGFPYPQAGINIAASGNGMWNLLFDDFIIPANRLRNRLYLPFLGLEHARKIIQAQRKWH